MIPLYSNAIADLKDITKLKGILHPQMKIPSSCCKPVWVSFL